MKPQAKVNNRYRNYTVSVPVELADEISRIARQHGRLEIEVLRQWVKLGLLATTGETPLYVKDEEGKLCELVMFEPKEEEKVVEVQP